MSGPDFDGARRCALARLAAKEAGVNFINVADAPMARVRMGPLVDGFAVCSALLSANA